MCGLKYIKEEGLLRKSVGKIKSILNLYDN